MESFGSYEERDHEMLYDDENCELRRYKNLPIQKKYALMQEQSKELAAKYGKMFLPKEVALGNSRKKNIIKKPTKLPVNNESITLSPNTILERAITKPLQTWTIKGDDNESENFILEKINTCSYNLKFAEVNTTEENNNSQVFNIQQVDESFCTENTPVEIPVFKKPKPKPRNKPTKKTPKYDVPASKDPCTTSKYQSSSSKSLKTCNNNNLESELSANYTFMEFLKFANRFKPDDPANTQQSAPQTDRCRTPSAFHSPRRPTNIQLPLSGNSIYPFVDNNFPVRNQTHTIHRPNPYPKPRYFYDRIQEPSFYPPFCRPVNVCYPPPPFMAPPPNIPPPNILPPNIPPPNILPPNIPPPNILPQNIPQPSISPPPYFHDYFRYTQVHNYQPFPVVPVNHHYNIHPFYPVNFPYPPRNY